MRRRAWVMAMLSAAALWTSSGCSADPAGPPIGSPGPDAPPGLLRVSPATADFGTIVRGTLPSAPVQITNLGEFATQPLVLTLSGSNANEFEVVPGDCSGTALAAGRSCRVAVRFNPGSAGPKSAALTIDGGAAFTSQLWLTGVALTPGDLVLDPDALDFGAVDVGSNATVALTLRNRGVAAIAGIRFSVGGSSAADVAVRAGSSCLMAPLAAGASCPLMLGFTPITAGTSLASVVATGSELGTGRPSQSATSLVALAHAQLRLIVAGTGQGAVTSFPMGLSCPVGCVKQESAFTDSPIVLMATASDGSRFDGFEGCNTHPTIDSCVVKLAAASTMVVATFSARADAGASDAQRMADAPSDAGMDAPLSDEPDAGPASSFRPWSGPGARLRFINADLSGPGSYAKLCLFGADGDSRPYAVLIDEAHAADETSYTKSASYGAVPAGPLKFMVFATRSPSADPAGCSLGAAVPANQGGPLVVDGSYTAVLTSTDSTARCQRAESSGSVNCKYAPALLGLGPDTSFCPQGGVFFVRDDVYPLGRYRVANLTGNAATLAYATGSGDRSNAINLELTGGQLLENDGHVALSPLLQICPGYLAGCYGARISGTNADEALRACAANDVRWTLNGLSLSRIRAEGKRTTVFVIGKAWPPADDFSALESRAAPNRVQLIVAADVAD